jgi:hypothetical protein
MTKGTVVNTTNRELAQEPEDLARLFNNRANAGEVEGLVALYEPDAVVAVGAVVATGQDEIRRFYTDLLSRRSSFSPVDALPALQNGSIAMTFAGLPNGNISVEAARQQENGTWLWLIDQLKIKPLSSQGG